MVKESERSKALNPITGPWRTGQFASMLSLMNPRFLLGLAFALAHWPMVAAAQSPTPVPLAVAPPGPVVVVELHTDISKAQFLYLRRALKEASAAGASAIILDMNTYGGELGAALESMEALVRLDIPVYTFVNSNAGSAGALISLATDEIFMAPVSAIGAAAPVAAGGEEISKTMQQKTISYVGGVARSVAQRKGHHPELVAGFLDADAEVKIGEVIISPKGSLLTLTAEEAVRRIDGRPVYAEAIVGSVDALIDRLELPRQTISVRPSGFEQAALWITRLAPLFLLIGLAGAYLEFKTPGLGLPGIASAVAFLLFFTGHYIAGLTGHGTTLLFVIGVALVLVEIFLIPGTLAAGIVGGFLMLGSLIWAMVDYYPSDGWQIDPGAFALPLFNLALAIVLAFGLAIGLAAYLPRLPAYRHLILHQIAGAPPEVIGQPSAVPEPGTLGEAVSALRPSGKIRVSGQYLDAIAEGEYLEAGTRVVVRGMESGSVRVAREAG